MRHLKTTVLLAVVIAGAIALPAAAGTSAPAQMKALADRVTALEGRVASISHHVSGVNKRASKLAAIVDRINDRTTTVRVDSATGLTNSSRVAFATATCGAGEHVTGGGGAFEFPLSGDTTILSRPYGNGWRVSMRRGDPDRATLHVYAMCERFGV